MKRRLTRAYDTMTMPDRCSETIERKLTEQLEQQKNGNYTRILSAAPGYRRSWSIGIAAVCLLLILSAGGTMLFLRTSDIFMDRPEEIIFDEAEQETGVAATPDDYYALVTDFSAKEVEAFAKVVRYNMMETNWKALEGKIQFPLTVQDRKIQNGQEFEEWIDAFFMYSVSRNKLEQESCEAMFCNWQGICMADGFIWINEVDGELKITAMNMDIKPITVTDTPVKQVPEAFAEVLAGKAVFFYGGNYGPRTLEEYCAGIWGEVTVDRFAVVDMDGDGVCEVVVSMQTAEEKSRAHLVLRQDGKYICGYRFQPGEMIDLKKDGTFFRRDRDHRVYFNDEESYLIAEAQEQIEKPLVQWHAYPCLRPELVLRSYEYVTGTGWPSLPAMSYYSFDALIQKRAANDWEVQKPIIFKTGITEGNQVFIFDPDAPGHVMYGTLTEENGFAQFDTLGFYVSDEYGERQAEARKLHTDSPEYWVGTHLELLDSHGWQVQSPEELTVDFGFTPKPDGRTQQDTKAIKAVIDGFAEAYLAGDIKSMKSWMADDYQGSVEGFAQDWEMDLMNYGVLPEHAMEVGETFAVQAGLRQSGIYHGLQLNLVKQENAWKVTSYRFCQAEE